MATYDYRSNIMDERFPGQNQIYQNMDEQMNYRGADPFSSFNSGIGSFYGQPNIYPGSEYSPHRGFEEMQSDETVQTPEKTGFLSNLKSKFSNFKFPSVLGLAKQAIEPNTPEEKFGLEYFEPSMTSSGRIWEGFAPNDVFGGINVASAWGEGAAAAGQKRVDKIDATIQRLTELDADKHAQTIENLKKRSLVFQNQLKKYNQDLKTATGGTDTTTTPTTTGTDTTGGSDRRNVSHYRPGGHHMTRSQNQGGLGLTQRQASDISRANRAAGMKGWGLAEGGRPGYAYGEFVDDENINVEGPSFDVDENIETAGFIDPQDALNDMAMEIFGKPLHELTGEEYQMLIDMANEQAEGPRPVGDPYGSPQGEEVVEEGIASLV